MTLRRHILNQPVMSKFATAAAATLLSGTLLLPFHGWAFQDAGGPAVRTERAQATSVRPDDFSITSISGLSPNRTGPNELVFARGWCSNSSGKYRIVFETDVRVDLNKIGPNGVDSTASREAGELYAYVLGNSRTGNAAIILSNQISYSKVVKPGEYDVIRKLPWGFVLVDNQIPPFHFSGWGNPFTRFTESGTTPRWQVLASSSSKDGFSVVSLRKFIPDNARMAYILVKASNTIGTRAGSAFFRVIAAQGDGVQIGELAKGQVAYFPLHQRVSSKRELYFKTTGDVTLDIWILGYTNTEPS
jgi:hypothetical protein